MGCNPACRIAEACEIFHEIGIGQTVEAVVLDALCFEMPRNRQQMDSAGKDGAIRHVTRIGV